MRVYEVRKLLKRERGRITSDTIKRILGDHTNAPSSVCIHAENPAPSGSHCMCSHVIDLTAKTLEVTWGNPCQSEYYSVDVSDVL